MSAPTRSTPPGTAVHADFRKYDGAEHWQEPYVLLGVDGYGVWLGMSSGTRFSRPGRTMVAATDGVRLIPHTGPWAAIFNAPGEGARIHTYVDITDEPDWQADGDGFRVVMTDLDLDVVLGFDGESFIDDEDEFLEHSQMFGYPEPLMARTRAVAEEVLARVNAGRSPFDRVAQDWLARLR